MDICLNVTTGSGCKKPAKNNYDKKNKGAPKKNTFKNKRLQSKEGGQNIVSKRVKQKQLASIVANNLKHESEINERKDEQKVQKTETKLENVLKPTPMILAKSRPLGTSKKKSLADIFSAENKTDDAIKFEPKNTFGSNTNEDLDDIFPENSYQKLKNDSEIHFNKRHIINDPHKATEVIVKPTKGHTESK